MNNQPATNHASSVEAEEKKQAPRPDLRLGDLPGALALITVVFIVVVSYVAHYYVNEHSASIKFATGAIFSFLALIVIVFQVAIYWRQADIMQSDLDMQRAITNPRLRVTDVKVVNLSQDKRPTFVIAIANDGMVDASNVQIHVVVDIKGCKSEWTKDPVVTIAAKGEYRDFITPEVVLTAEDLKAFNEAAPIKVSGYFIHWIEGRKDFCYRYKPFDGQRPVGVPEFVGCDRGIGLNVARPITGVEAAGHVGRFDTITTYPANMIKRMKESPKESTKREYPEGK